MRCGHRQNGMGTGGGRWSDWGNGMGTGSGCRARGEWCVGMRCGRQSSTGGGERGR